MPRRYAAGLLAVLAGLVLYLTLRGGPSLLGQWTARVELGGEQTAVVVRYGFASGGVYTCSMALDGAAADREASVQGKYLVRGDRLYFSRGLAYRVDMDVYNRYRLEGDRLTILDGGEDVPGSIFPLTLTRVPEDKT